VLQCTRDRGWQGGASCGPLTFRFPAKRTVTVDARHCCHSWHKSPFRIPLLSKHSSCTSHAPSRSFIAYCVIRYSYAVYLRQKICGINLQLRSIRPNSPYICWATHSHAWQYSESARSGCKTACKSYMHNLGDVFIVLRVCTQVYTLFSPTTARRGVYSFPLRPVLTVQPRSRRLDTRRPNVTLTSSTSYSCYTVHFGLTTDLSEWTVLYIHQMSKNARPRARGNDRGSDPKLAAARFPSRRPVFCFTCLSLP